MFELTLFVFVLRSTNANKAKYEDPPPAPAYSGGNDYSSQGYGTATATSPRGNLTPRSRKVSKGEFGSSPPAETGVQMELMARIGTSAEYALEVD